MRSGVQEKERRNADLGEKRNEESTGVNREKEGKKNFLLVFPSIITHTHFPEGHCTC